MTTTTELATRRDVRPARVELWPGQAGPRLVLSSGLLAPRVIRLGAARAEVALVATTASLLGGDELRLEVVVGRAQHLSLRDVAATVAYHGRGLACGVDVRLRVQEGATLTWAGEPLVVSEGAKVRRSLRAEVAEGGRLLLRDQVVLGRHGERGGSLECHTRLVHDGTVALAETLDLRDEQGSAGAAFRDQVGVLGGARVVSTVTALGWRPVAAGPAAPGVFALAAPGAMGRTLAASAHRTATESLWLQWQSELVTLTPTA